jgi:hypothetical protein
MAEKMAGKKVQVQGLLQKNKSGRTLLTVKEFNAVRPKSTKKPAADKPAKPAASKKPVDSKPAKSTAPKTVDQTPKR